MLDKSSIMSKIIKAIKDRRSIRKYVPKQVSTEDIKEMLEAARWAPSAHNAQPWRFIVLEKASVKEELSEAMAKAWDADLIKDGAKIEASKRKANVERFANAPALILACLSLENMRKFNDAKRKKCERDLAMQSLGAAIQNLLLMVHAKGLGACWFSAPSFCKQTVRKALKIPKNIEPQALIAVGYPAEKASSKRNSLSDFCFVDTWGKKLV